MVAPAPGPVTPVQLASECREGPLVFDDVSPDLCASLEQIILGRMRGSRTKTGSINVGGWKSGEDFFNWGDPAVQQLYLSIAQLVGARQLVGWAMVNRAGSRHPRHQHRAAIISGVYYVTTGSPEAITPTVFECPCDGRPVRPSDRYELEVEPHPGRIVLCRGETWHRVPVYNGDLPRITVAFDVRR